MFKRLAYSLLLVLMFGWGLSGCSDNQIDNPYEKTLGQLVVEPGFNWATSTEYKLIIQKPESGVIRVESDDLQILYHKGFYTGLEEGYPVMVSVPSSIHSLMVNGQAVELRSSIIVVNLKGSGLKAGTTVGSHSSTLISFWSMNENSGVTAHDGQGTNNGTLTGGTAWVGGIKGSAVYFDGVNDYITIPNSASLSPEKAVTLTAWVKADDYRSAKIVQKGDWDGYALYVDLWRGWKGSIYLADRTNHDVAWNADRPLLNTWYHLAMTYDGSVLRYYVNGVEKGSNSVAGQLFKNSRSFTIGSDNGAQKFFKGAVDEVYLYGSVLSPEEIVAHYRESQVDDLDGDGVPDADDDFPDDGNRAFLNYFPANGFGSLAFEDLWPGKGDYDFNDLVVDYRFTQITNALNQVVEITGDFTVRAIGASFDNGLGFQFGSEKINQKDIVVTGSRLSSDTYFRLNDTGLESGQAHPTVIVFDNARDVLKWQGGFGVNVDPDATRVAPETVSIRIEFKTREYYSDDIRLTAFNPFLVVKQNRGREIHLADMPPTSLANQDLFGTSQDDSDPGAGRYYKTDGNLPLAINIASSFNYPVEKAEITSAHLKFFEWAASSGKDYPDWYLDLNGYRNTSKIYPGN